MTSSRKYWIGGNWKSNGTSASNAVLCESLNANPDAATNHLDVIIFPSFLHVKEIANTLDKSKYAVGVQTVSHKGNGAFTGEVSTDMLTDSGICWALVGHSERRQYNGETDEVVALKIEACQNAEISAVLCIGETLQERKDGSMRSVLEKQLNAAIPVIKEWSKIVIAYEPVWAIGTGVVATPEQAQEAHEYIKSVVAARVDEVTAADVRIVYGGSVTEKNCASLIVKKDIGGFLVGGASLKPEFGSIISEVAKKANK